MGTVSVVIPAYNASAFIKASVGSALSQSLHPDEVFVVNDVCTDDTIKKLKPFRKQLHVVSMDENSGPGTSRNKGVAVSTGDYIAFLDADDIWEEDHLKDLVGLLDKHPDAGVAFCKMRTIGHDHKVWPAVKLSEDEPIDLFMDMMRRSYVSPSASLVRRSVFEEAGGFKEMHELYKGKRVQAEDYDFFLRAGRITKFICSSRSTVLYRRHEAQSSAQAAPQIVLSVKYRLRLLRELEKEAGQEALIRSAIEATLKRWQEYLTSVCVMGNKEAIDYTISFGMAEDLLKDCTRKFLPVSKIPAGILSVWSCIPRAVRKILDV